MLNNISNYIMFENYWIQLNLFKTGMTFVISVLLWDISKERVRWLSLITMQIWHGLKGWFFFAKNHWHPYKHDVLYKKLIYIKYLYIIFQNIIQNAVWYMTITLAITGLHQNLIEDWRQNVYGISKHNWTSDSIHCKPQRLVRIWHFAENQNGFRHQGIDAVSNS